MRTNVIAERQANPQPLATTRPAALRELGLLVGLVCAAILMGLLVSCGQLHEPAAASSRAAASPAASATSQDAESKPLATKAAPRAVPVPDQDRPPSPPQPDPARAALPPFPWPPPPYSASMVIPRHVLLQNMHQKSAHSAVHLKDVDAVLRKSLRNAGYEYSYFSVERGFALVSRMERITAAGAPYPDPKLRFDASLKLVEHFSLADYLQALFVAPPGYFRVIAFIVSPLPFSATGKPVSADEASAWLQQGANRLPAATGQLSYSKDYACTALIYEFEKRDTKADPSERQPGRLSAETHLVMSGIKLGPLKQPAQ